MSDVTERPDTAEYRTALARSGCLPHHRAVAVLDALDAARAELAKSNASLLAMAKRLGEVTARVTVIADQAALAVTASGIDCTGLRGDTQ